LWLTDTDATRRSLATLSGNRIILLIEQESGHAARWSGWRADWRNDPGVMPVA